MIIGIDLGTTNSLAAYYTEDGPRIIPNRLGERLTPSAVSIDENDQVYVGKTALERMAVHPDEGASLFKRSMGSRKEFHLGGRTFSAEELSSFVLRSLKEDAEYYLGQEVTEAVVPLGPQSSQVAIKQLGTNGGGFNGANSASALENPTPLTNLLQCAAMPLIPFALVFAFGRMVGDRRQSRALMTVVLAILAAGLFSVIAETAATPQLSADGAVYLGALDQSAGNMEGKECRIGVGESAAWTALTSATSNGSANASIEAMTPIGTLVPLALIGLGEVVGGGVGTGLVGLLGFAVLAVFVASLMIGRSPEYLGKKLGPAEMRMAVVIVVAPALAILLAASVLVMSPASAAAVGTPAPFGFTELLYAATSAGGNNGSGLSGLSSNTPLINVVLGVEMLFARLAPLAAALVLAGNLAQLKVQATGAVGLSTSGALFAVLLLVIIVLIGALSLLPAFALGPLAEQFMGAF